MSIFFSITSKNIAPVEDFKKKIITTTVGARREKNTSIRLKLNPTHHYINCLNLVL